MKKGLSEVVYVVDRSGSMAGLESDTIGGINANLRSQREACAHDSEQQVVVSTVLFNHGVEVLHDRVDVSQVSDLTPKDYQVGGCTALLDAVGGAIKHVSRVHGYLPDEYVPEHTILVITTDGLENASEKFTYQQVKRMVEQKTELGWDFLFLGANIDAAAEAGRLGVRQENAATYLSDHAGTQVMYQAVCSRVNQMREGSADMTGSWRAIIDEDVASRG